MTTTGEDMREIQVFEFLDCYKLTDEISCGRIYPLSVLQGYQQGRIFELESCTLIWHLCGFAFLCGEASQKDCESIFGLMEDAGAEGKRLVLFSEKTSVEKAFMKLGAKADDRIFFEYAREKNTDIMLPDGFEMRRIDAENIGKLDGRIKPSFSWESDESFLAKGVGFCVMHGDTPAAWAFSAAVSDDEIDIGVETLERFRGKGLAAAAASEMIRFSLAAGKKPVWACHAGNIGSQKVAEKLGFEKVGECRTIFL